MKLAPKHAIRRLCELVRGPSPILSPASNIVGLDEARIAPTARLYVREDRGNRRGHIVLGKGVYVGRNVELATSAGGDLAVGEDTSIQDGCVFHGDVRIGSHCVFGPNQMISTTIHRFRDMPELLIRDQDAIMASLAEKPADYSRPITIEDDCWLGWGAAYMPGITIGRGAIVGANCVVTRDIGPYEIHGGVPNRLIGKRLEFSPPAALSASARVDLPYFYRGFRLSQADLHDSATGGVRSAHARAALVLAGGAKNIVVEGIVLDQTRPLNLLTRMNGNITGSHRLTDGAFRLEIHCEADNEGELAPHSVLELIDGDHEIPTQIYGSANRYAILSARLI